VRSSTSNSDVRGGAPAAATDDQQSDYWRRSTPPRAWAAMALVTALITAGLTSAWEMYWRAQWHVAGDFKDSDGLWADQRRRATGDATVIIGSSRGLFGLDLDAWEEAGRGRPVQLALPGQAPRFDPHKLATAGPDRNSELWARILEDEAYREEAQQIWILLWPRMRAPNDEQLAAIITETRRDVERIRARGGDVVFIRLPYAGVYEGEDERFPRDRFWDRLLRETGAIGVAWQDHRELQGYDTPDWSHLGPREAERYTRELTRILYAEIDQTRDAERRVR
jgi:hypothetical protein